MTDVINLNSIRSGDCACNKPKPNTCGCTKSQNIPCGNLLAQPIDLNKYFKVKNLFSELNTEWQRAEARLNLGVTDIIDLRQVLASDESGGTNIWEMTVSKGGSNRVYDFVVRNGLAGKSASIEIAEPFMLSPDSIPKVNNLGTATDVVLLFGIPSGKPGENGAPGESAFAIANRIQELLGLPIFFNEEMWLESLKGKKGDTGEQGELDPRGKSAYEIYLETTLDSPKLTKEEWLESLKGKADNSKQIVDVFPTRILHNLVYRISSNYTYSGDVIEWRIEFLDESYKTFWTPYNVTGDTSEVDVEGIIFLFHKETFDHIPTDAELATKLSELSGGMNYVTTGKPVENLSGWQYTAPAVLTQGRDFIYLATAKTLNGAINGYWSVVQLTGQSGHDCDCGENPDPTTPEDSTKAVYDLDYEVALELAVIPKDIIKNKLTVGVGLNLTVFNKTNKFILVTIPYTQFSRSYTATNKDNSTDVYGGVFSCSFTEIKIICPPKELGNSTNSVSFYANCEYDADSNTSVMTNGGYLTTMNIFLQSNDLFLQGTDINDYEYEDIQAIVYDLFEYLDNDKSRIIYRYKVPGQIAAKFISEADSSISNLIDMYTAFGMRVQLPNNVNWDNWTENITTNPYINNTEEVDQNTP